MAEIATEVPELRIAKVRDERIEAMFSRIPGMELHGVYQIELAGREFQAFLGRENLGVGNDDDRRWHLSVAGLDMLPPWGLMVMVAHELRPGVPFVIGLPPKSWWINIHDYCLHCWELKDDNLVAQWRRERQAHKPT